MGCHTTGFDFVPPDPPPASQHWKMQGAGEMAIGCERCHGPGSKHVEAAKQKEAEGSKLNPDRDQLFIVHGLRDLSLDQQNQVCGQCHARLGGKSMPILAFPDLVDHKHFLPGDSNVTERARLELHFSSDHYTRQSAQHDNWSRLRQLLARWPRQEESHAVARPRGRPARMEGGRQLHDLPCISRRCGFKGPATAIETTAASEGALRVVP
jgi:hypothetical protein